MSAGCGGCGCGLTARVGAVGVSWVAAFLLSGMSCLVKGASEFDLLGAAAVELLWAAQVLLLSLPGQWPMSECPYHAVPLVSSCGTREVGVPCRMRGMCASGCSFVSCKCQGHGSSSSREGRMVLGSSCSLESWGLLFLSPFPLFLWLYLCLEGAVGWEGWKACWPCLSCLAFPYPCCLWCLLD